MVLSQVFYNHRVIREHKENFIYKIFILQTLCLCGKKITKSINLIHYQNPYKRIIRVRKNLKKMEIITTNFSNFHKFIKKYRNDIFLLCDENTENFCLPKVLEKVPYLADCKRIIIKSGEQHKTLATIAQIWRFLTENGSKRTSLLVNIGGGAVCDLGGFAATTFKRGMDFVNIPTTLLAAIDAAVGGKTGFNFLGYKNEIGVFAEPKTVIIDIELFESLGNKNLWAGYAEMLKHGYISSKTLLEETFSFICGRSMNEIEAQNIDNQKFTEIILQNLKIKQHYLQIDKFDKKERKALNFGHTFGHAFETFSHKTDKPLLHGEAVAWGMVCELLLSHILLNFSKEEVLRLFYFVKENYPAPNFSCKNSQEIFEIMQHDKKNYSNEINFTLLSDIGKVKINKTAKKAQILECLDFLC